MTSKSNIAVWRKAGLMAGLAALVLAAALSFGQQLTGTLNGTTMDSTGAVVPNAKVTLKNEASGDVRTTVSNATGYFTITAIQPGTYTATISSTGFKEWKQSGIVFNQGDNRTLPDIALQVGAVNETVEISAGALAVPTDNAEVSATMPQHMVNAFPMASRDAGDLLKIMPGMAFAGGSNQGSGWNEKTVGSANGPVGAFSANGTQPSGAMSFMLDGANLVDPGNAGGQMANINPDMVQEVKVLTSNYSAEYAKGPVIFQAFSRSGGAKYHGEGYVYAKNSAMNSIDAFTHSQIVNLPAAQQGAAIATAAPAESFYYFGGNIGGPIPKLAHGNNKLFFWGGYEYMRQHPAGSIIDYNTPTSEQLSGDFSNTTLNGIPGSTSVGPGTTLIQKLQSVWGFAYNNLCCAIPAGATSTSVPSSVWDPNGAIYAKMMPTKASPNGGAIITPNAGNGWNNYQFVSQVPQNRWEATGKVDYAIGDNTKISGSYSRQIEGDQKPVGIWWTPPWTLPYPSGVTQNYTSEMIMANATHVFSPTTTNEAVFNYTLFNSPATLGNPNAVSRSKLGMSIPSLFGSTVDQMPNIGAPWGGSFPGIGNMNLEGTFPGGGFGADKRTPAAYDNLTRVIGSHTLKVGAYYDREENFQPSSGFGNGANGTFNVGNAWGAAETNNVVADFLLGVSGNYQQPNKDIVNYIYSNVWAIYGQDQWKMNRQLTLNYGLRLDHNGQWYNNANGMAVWDPAVYVNGTPAKPITANNTGLEWNSIDKSIPLSGWTSPLFNYEPRVGLAYDVFGNGKTVIRAGFASFRYNVSVNDVGGPTSLASGIFTATTPALDGYSKVSTYTPPSSVAANGSTFTAMQMGDNRTPYTNDWNVGVAEALPWRSVFEMTYVGNHSGNELVNGNNGKLSDANSNFPGSEFLPDPHQGGMFVSPGGLTCKNTGYNAGSNYAGCNNMGPNNVALSNNYNLTFNENNYRRLTNYNDVYVLNHGSYANYNSLQMSWQKQAGSVNFMMNYTYSKVLGIRDGNSDQAGSNGGVVDPFSLRNNYGPLAYDHTNIANFTYVWNTPKFYHGSRFIEGAIDGWQLSGYTTYQSGAPLQANGTLNFSFAGGLTYPLAGLAPGTLPDETVSLPNGLRSNAVNQSTWFGTSQNGGGYAAMIPLVTCNPQNHASGKYFNPNCFSTPAQGQVGTFDWPYIKAPAYFDSDLGVYKTFKVTESKSVQFRVQATNFLNHPLPQFGLAGNSDETINLQQNTTITFPTSAITTLPANPGNDANYPCDSVGGTLASAGTCKYIVHSIAGTNTNTSMTGKPAFKTGSRVMTFSVKFYF